MLTDAIAAQYVAAGHQTRPSSPPLAPPVPDKATFCGLPAALSVMLTAARRVPMAVGLKVTLIVQLPPAGNELPQV
jgi:hypothetical protein